MQKALLSVILFLVSIGGMAQKPIQFCGEITNESGEVLPGVTVLSEDIQKGTFTDSEGKFCLEITKSGKANLLVSAIGFVSQKVEVAADLSQTLKIVLKEDSRELSEVKVVAEKQLSEVRKQGFQVTAINLKKLHNNSQNLNQLMNTITGVKVREEGGLGSRSNFSLNGFTGRQIKFFIDGVSMDNFGSSLTINNLPINLAERIEVYKGVVPIELGSDALGGAVNIITNQQAKRYLDVAYQVGSFNTHRFSLIGNHVAENGFTVKANVFVNHADNNYKVKIQLPDPLTGKYGPVQRIPRFHDAYDSQSAQVSVGVSGKKWADVFLIGLIASKNKKEIQTGMNMENVAGLAFNKSQSFIPTLTFKKDDFFIKGLDLKLNANYSFVRSSIVDSSSRKYDWSGNYEVKSFGSKSGEISYNKTLFTFDDQNALLTGIASYKLNAKHSYAISHTFNKARRQGEDPISVNPIAFEVPNYLSKNITGFAYKYGNSSSKFSATLFGKFFQMKGFTIDADYWEDTQEGYTSSYSKFGYGTALTYRLTSQIRLKTSAENTWRLPEGEEMFGNGLLLENNPLLRPEHSQNVNLGVQWNRPSTAGNLGAELGLLYRSSSDFIRLQSTGIISQYTNLDSVRTLGIEAAFKAGLLKNKLNLDLNATYQNIKNINKYEGGVISYLYGDRLPNLPYFFGNANLSYQWLEPFAKGDALNFGWGLHYVHDFYLFWPSQGSASSKFLIPQQISQNAYASYSIKQGKMNVSAECNNLTNADLFDNFRLQKPGRAFNIKLRYFLN